MELDMNNNSEKEELIKEIVQLNEKINKLDLNDEERKLERMSLLQKYNDTKDHAQRLLGALAECEKLSTGLLYKKLGIEFDP